MFQLFIFKRNILKESDWFNIFLILMPQYQNSLLPVPVCGVKYLFHYPSTSKSFKLTPTPTSLTSKEFDHYIAFNSHTSQIWEKIKSFSAQQPVNVLIFIKTHPSFYLHMPQKNCQFISLIVSLMLGVNLNFQWLHSKGKVKGHFIKV